MLRVALFFVIASGTLVPAFLRSAAAIKEVAEKNAEAKAEQVAEQTERLRVAEGPVSGWTEVNTPVPGSSVRMPGQPKTQTLHSQFGSGTVIGLELPEGAFTINHEKYHALAGRPTFDQRSAKEARDGILEEMKRRLRITGGRVLQTSPVRKKNGYWTFTMKREQPVAGHTGTYYAYYVLHPSGVLILQYGAREAEGSTAVKFFRSLRIPKP